MQIRPTCGAVTARRLFLGVLILLVAACQSAKAPDAQGPVGQISAAVAALPPRGPVSGLLQPSGSGTCYPWRQAFADMVMRLHTQMLVTGLTCDEAYGRPDLYGTYRQFTLANAETVRSAEQVTAARLGGLTAFDTYRSRLANAEALLAVEATPGTYCAARQARFRTMETGDFREYATALTMRQLSSLPNCDASPR